MKEIKIIPNNNEKCLAVYASDYLKFPGNNKDKEYNRKEYNCLLSSLIEDWAYSNKDQTFDILLATLICKNKKDKRCDLENLLIYNLNRKKEFNNLLHKLRKIILQCIENVHSTWPGNYNYVYFYRLFEKEEEDQLSDIILYKPFNIKFKFVEEIEINTITELIDACDVYTKQNLIKEIQKNKVKSKLPCRTKYALEIEIPHTLNRLKMYIQNVDKFKKFLDCVIIYLNAKNLIEHHNGNLVNGNGYNPSDNYLYYCKVILVNSNIDKIQVKCYSVNCEKNCEKLKNDIYKRIIKNDD